MSEEIKDQYYKDFDNKNDKHLKVILKELCKRVKAPVTKINFAEPDWFMLYSWTESEENEFKKWVSDYLYKGNAEVRRQLTGHNIKSRTMANNFANNFVFTYGWTLKPTERLGVR